jgi:large subunit ribosomal protein L29
MDARDLRTKENSELREELTELLQEQFNLRMQKGTGQLVTPHQLRRVRRDIARVRTVLREKDGAAASASASTEAGESA